MQSGAALPPPLHFHYHKRSLNHGGPPPAKRSKGNPIITRYPPPPGYQPPAPLHHHQQSWQQNYTVPSCEYVQPPSAVAYNYSSHAQQLVAPTHTYTSSFSAYQPNPHQPSQATYCPPSQPSSAAAWQSPVSGPLSAPPALWSSQAPSHKSRRQNSITSDHFSSAGVLIDGNGDPMPPLEPGTASSMDNLEEEFDGECHFARYPNEIDPNLSLGLIEWKAPQPSTRSLPSTFKEAELDVIAPRPAKAAGQSVSDYLTNTNLEEALLSIRQTDAWAEAKHDLIFREFALVCARIISLPELRMQYRHRVDPDWDEAEQGSVRALTPSISRPPTRQGTRSSGNVYSNLESTSRSRQSERMDDPAGRSQLLDDLEHTLFPKRRGSRSATHSRSSSVASQGFGKLTRPKPLPVVHDQAQEDILAALGVTGSAQMVYQTPGPAFGPPPPSKNGGKPHSRAASISSAHDSMNSFPKSTSHHVGVIGQPLPAQQQRSTSLGSQDSDYGASALDCLSPVESDITPRPKSQQYRDFSRKRSYADSHMGGFEDCIPEEDAEETPRPKKQMVRI